MKNSLRLIIVLFVSLIFQKAYSQVDYSIKAETGYSKYFTKIINVDPGPDWKGYNLDDDNEIDLNVINGVTFNNRLFTGVGIGYLNFEGINGFSIFSDFEYFNQNKRISPLVNFKLGYSHIWNQYENGTGTFLGEFGAGINYKFTDQFTMYLKTGFTITQQSLLFPIRVGFRF